MASYSSTGYSSCVISSGAGYEAVKVHTITIFSITGKKDFVYEDDFLNAFSFDDIQSILNGFDTFTEYSAVNQNGDEIYYDLDNTATTFTHGLTGNNTNEKATVILVANPLIKEIHNPLYETNIYVEEVPTTQQIILTTQTVDKDNVSSSVTAVTGVDLKNAYLQANYAVFSGLSFNNVTLEAGYLTSPGRSMFYDNFSAEIIFDENFAYREGSGYRLITDTINIKISLNRTKYGLLKYWDTGKYIEIPFGLRRYELGNTYYPNSEVQLFTSNSYQVLSFDVSNFDLPYALNSRLLNKYIYTYIQYKSQLNYNECIYNLTIQGTTLDDIQRAPMVLAVNISPTDNTKVIITVKNGTTGILSYITNSGCQDTYTGKGVDFGSQPASIDGELYSEEVNVTL